MKVIRAVVTFLAIVLVATSVYASATLGTVDPNNDGSYKAQIQNASLGSATTINFGKFTTQAAKNITISNTELRGFAWGDGVGWIVMNCADTTSGCSSTNGNFKVANTSGVLSGFAWGETTGWVNFGPFSNSATPQVKIVGGTFKGTTGNAGYAWAQNFGWIKFDCTDASSCVKTDWTGGSSSGGGGGGGGSGVCTNPLATNYNAAGPCVYQTLICTDQGALNYGGALPCTYAGQTCLDPVATNYNSIGTCSYAPVICRDPIALNYNSQGLCTYPPSQCTDTTALNYGGALPCQYQQPFSCTLFPKDPSCVSQSYCTLHPQECFPPKNPTKIEIVGTTIKKTADGPFGKIISAAGVIAVGIGAVLPILFANPFSFYDLFLIFARLWSLLLAFFGLKKKARPWGTVYDSITKQPLDPAYVVLSDTTGNVIATSITDIDGRYGFSVPAGTYRIMANKTNYEFPSKKLAGKSEDELYNDLYFGGDIVVSNDGGIIAKNIPLDQLGFDWNEYAKHEQQRLRFYHRRDILVSRITSIFFIAGFMLASIAVLASTSVYNTVIFALYLALIIAKVLGIKAFPRGSVVDKATTQLLPFSVVRVISSVTNKEVLHKVADRTGKYYCLVANGNYRVVVDRKNADQSYTPHEVPDPVEVKKGYLKHDFKI